MSATSTAGTARAIRVAIVHYSDSAVAGGSLRVGQTLANHLDPSRVEVHLVFAYGGPGPVTASTTVPCHFLRANGPKDPRAWLRARRTITRLKPDIVHFMDSVVWLHGALLGTSHTKIVHVHGRPLASSMTRLNRTIWKHLPRIVAGHVCITEGARQTLLSLGWGRPDRAWAIYNAIDCGWFRDLPPRSKARQDLGIPRDAKVLGMVCRLTKFRGCDDAIRLLARLGDDWRLVLCGDGPFRSDLEDMSVRLGLRDRVHFTGSLDDVRPVYASIDGFLLLARHEPFGLAICEAMATGVPVFGLGGDGDYREPAYPLVTEENSVFVERRDPGNYDGEEPPETLDALARVISDYVEDPRKHQPMVERARSWVEQRFDAPLHAEIVARLYREVSQHGRSEPAALAELYRRRTLQGTKTR